MNTTIIETTTYGRPDDAVRIACAEVRRQAGSGKRIAFISGNFNVVHAGHLRLFKFATEMSDCVVVGFSPDGTRGVSVPSGIREEALRAISMIDFLIPLDGPPESVIAALKPEFVVKGKEFEGAHNQEQAVRFRRNAVFLAGAAAS
jgi:bifunctional ADP-heptose synthase (sugar kinase/adenylyltransferase)